MSVELNLVKGADLVPSAFLHRWQCRRSEITSVKQAAKLAANNQARLHVLTINGVDLGFVTVGVHQRKNQKLYHLQVIYLFVSAQFRKQKITELEGLLASEYMIGHVISQSLQTCKFIPVSSIMLETASDKL